MGESIELSVVATVYKHSATLVQLVQEIEAAVASLKVSYEILLVNDHSPDDSEAVIRSLCKPGSRIRGVTLARNVGQQIAVSAGISIAQGNYVVVMDGDLQNPPSAIVDLYTKVKEGYDLVYATSTLRNNWFDGVASKIFWFVVNGILKAGIVPNQLMMRIVSRKFANYFSTFSETNRVVETICEAIGLRQTSLPVKNRPRPVGRSSYNLFSRLDLFVRVLLIMSNRPLTMMMYGGLLGVFLAVIGGVNSIVMYMWHDVLPGYTSLILVISFFGSATLMMTGILGRYMAMIFDEVRRRPLYLVQDRFNFS